MFVLRLAEKIFVVFSLLFFTDAILPVVNEVSGIQINLIIQVCLVGIQAGSVLLLFAWWRKVFHTASKEKLLWILLGIVVVSVFWSDAPITTLGSIRNLLPVILLGVYFAARYSLKEQLQLLAWMLGIAALLSVAFALALPSYGVMGIAPNSKAEALSHVGAWRGIYSHKNVLGRIMVLSAVVFLLLATNSHKYRWLLWTGFGLSAGLILLSTSKTSLIIFLTLVFLLPLYKALRWNYSLAVPFFITVVLTGGSVAILFLGNAEILLGAFGRDLTLTGRTELWAAVLEKIWQRPWLGYGYFGFWRGLEGASTDVLECSPMEAPHSHNGLLDLWLDLGLLGLSVFILSFIAVCLRSVTGYA
jgi:O-antigen ligase